MIIINKRIIIFVSLVIAISACFYGCSNTLLDSSSNQESNNTSNFEEKTNDESSIDNLPSESQNDDSVAYITYENVQYKVNPVLSPETDIIYADYQESDGMTSVEFGWNEFSDDSGDGCKDILIMFYDNPMSDVKNGQQQILGSGYLHMTDEMVSEWSYFNSDNNLILTTKDYKLYDKNNNIIGYFSDDGTYRDKDGNEIDVESIDPFMKILSEF